MIGARSPAVAGAAILAAVGACVPGASAALAQAPNRSVLQAPALPAPIPLLPPRAPQPQIPTQPSYAPQPYAQPGQAYPTPSYAPAQPSYAPAQPYTPTPAAPPMQQDLLQTEPAQPTPGSSAPGPSVPGQEQATPSAPSGNAPTPPVDQTAPPVQSGWVPKQVAELHALDKVDAVTTPITVKVGQSVQYKTLTITVRACDARPADQPAGYTAFLDIVDSRPGAPDFHGWTLAHDPSLSMLQHPVYGVQLASCSDQQPPPAQAASSAKPESKQGAQP